ncbi:hypothetical protein GCM10010964_38320 [Caldovatus sediminis]|uniref:Uncharacterized protein n=1 Tax=Caldovatus sediminis TaxID=2041189 RepID=A0A8J3EEX1_9PROT|nr:hypothetical protein GCM10010964_38320 [Caldovatus sediminis]
MADARMLVGQAFCVPSRIGGRHSPAGSATAGEHQSVTNRQRCDAKERRVGSVAPSMISIGDRTRGTMTWI